MGVRRRPTLPPRSQGSTIGAVGLCFRVRNGTGRFPYAMTAVTLWNCQPVAVTVVVTPELHSEREHVTHTQRVWLFVEVVG